MRPARVAAAVVFALAVLAGTWRDLSSPAPAARPPGVLVADLHVHPFPGDGVLPVWELQREARRRGLDVIAIAGHNNRVALDLASALGRIAADPIVLESQELTAPDFHLIAAGVRTMIDWRLPVPEAVRAIHAQGGVAIAAHPVPLAWGAMDDASLGALDGLEVGHPMTIPRPGSRRELDSFRTRVLTLNPDVAPIGSSDFHAGAPLGLCRTYLLTEERTAAGALDAIRRGRTVAQDARGRLYGAEADIATVRRALPTAPEVPQTPLTDRLLALAALASLALGIWSRVEPC